MIPYEVRIWIFTFIFNTLSYEYWNQGHHYIDVIMTTMASQITSLMVVYSTVYSDADQRKCQSSASLAFVWGEFTWTGEFPAQRASYAENVSIWWCHHVLQWCHIGVMASPITGYQLATQLFSHESKLLKKILKVTISWQFLQYFYLQCQNVTKFVLISEFSMP